MAGRRGEKSLRETASRLEKQQQALLSMAKHKTIRDGDFPAAVHYILETAAVTIGVERVSVWLYEENRKRIRCFDLFERTRKKHSNNLTLEAKQYPIYFRALDRQRTIAADDAHTDKRTKEFSVPYLSPFKISSMLDAGIFVGGESIGVVCNEHVGRKRSWTPDEQTFAASVADMVAIAFDCSKLKEVEDRTEHRRQIEEALRESELRFREMAESVDEVFWMTDLKKSKILYVSPAYERIWGRSCESLYRIPKSFLSSIHPDDRKRVTESFPLQELGRYDVEYRIIRPDGSIRWIRDRAYPIRDASGTVYRVAGIADDMTDQKRAEEALKESSERFNLAVTGSNDGIWDGTFPETGDWYSPDSEIYFSPRAKQLLGFEPEELPNKFGSVLAQIHPQDLVIIMHAVKEHLEKRYPLDVEVRIKTQTGEFRWFQCRGQAIWDETGRPKRMAGSIRDITDRKQAEAAVRELETRNRQYLDAIPDFVFVKESESRIHWANKAFCDYYGMTVEQLQGILDSPVNKPDYTKKYVRDDAYVFRTGKTLHIPEEPVVRHDGETRLFETLKSPIFNSEGTVTMVIGVARDITERKRTDAEFRRLARITSMSADAIIEVDMNQRITLWNLAAEKLFGFTSKEVLGRDMREFFVPPSDQETVNKMFLRNQQRPEAILFGERVKRLHKDGRIIPVTMTAFPIFDEFGILTGRAAIMGDLTHVIQIENKLLEQSRMAAIGQMAAGVAHEIRNPLFGISAVAQILGKQSVRDEETQVLADQMRAEIDRLKRLLDNLLLYGRPRKLERSNIDPLSLCQAILEFHSASMKTKNVRVVSSFRPENGSVSVDTEQMRQVLLNLCLNALQSSPEGGVIEVESRIFQDTSPRWVLRVSNSGEPIQPECSEKVFDPFFSTRREGSGLGLPVCRKIVEEHGGKLILERSDPHATVFSFTIPLANA